MLRRLEALVMHNAGCGDVVGVNVLVADSRQMRNQKECEERSGSVAVA